MNYKKHVLKNGLRVITVPIPQSESVTALILVGAGSRYENRKNNGISHFLEHMAFKGTEKLPDAQAIASTIEGIGAEFNAYTSKDHTGYYIKSAKKHLPLLVDVLSDMLLHSKYDPKEIEKEKGVIIEEIRMYEDMPMRKIGDLYESLLYGDTPLGWDIAGTEEIIRGVTRNDFVDYVTNYYSPLNTVVVLAGGISDEKEVETMVEEKMGEWKSHETPRFEKHSDSQNGPKLLLHTKKTEQAHLSLGVRTFSLTDSRKYALTLLSSILGGGMSSRLFTEVREKRGLAYYVRSSGEHYQDVGNFVTQAGVDLKRIDDAIKVIIEEILKITTGEITDEEFERSKEYVKGHFILDLEDSRTIASLVANAEVLEGKIKTPSDVLTALEKVTKEDVKNVAKEIFKKERLNLAVIGPFDDKERFEKIIR